MSRKRPSKRIRDAQKQGQKKCQCGKNIPINQVNCNLCHRAEHNAIRNKISTTIP
jgi:hypothetical protein